MSRSSSSNSPSENLLRRLPSVERVLTTPNVQSLTDAFGRNIVTDAVRAVLSELRSAVDNGIGDSDFLDAIEAMASAVAARIEQELSSSLRPVVNATGIVVHTNLGRAPLSTSAIEAIARVARGYSSLELDLSTGKRGSRHRHASQLLSHLFPGHDAIVVNNAAAAVMLSLNTFAAGREVVISRGELVEIGGSFRVPDILERSGASLREVGTTNKTRIADYRDALSDATGALLRVHPSNFKIVGFTETATTRELVELGAEAGVPVIEDFGSGNLLPLAPYGLDGEATVRQSLDTGVTMSIFSGDKLLGGPQAGLLVGHPDAVDACRNNPMARALRVDKLTYAALVATLRAFATEDAVNEIPVLRMLAQSAAEVRARATAFASVLQETSLEVSVEDDCSRVGGGAAADATLPTSVVAVSKPDISADALLRGLRESDPPVIARISADRVLLDLRTVLPEDESTLHRVLRELA